MHCKRNPPFNTHINPPLTLITHFCTLIWEYRSIALPWWIELLKGKYKIPLSIYPDAFFLLLHGWEKWAQLSCSTICDWLGLRKCHRRTSYTRNLVSFFSHFCRAVMALLLFFIARLNFFIESSELSRCLFFFLQEYHEKSFVEVRIETRDYASLVCLEMAYFFYHTWARNVTHIEYWCFSCITSIQKNIISISSGVCASEGCPTTQGCLCFGNEAFWLNG